MGAVPRSTECQLCNCSKFHPRSGSGIVWDEVSEHAESRLSHSTSCVKRNLGTTPLIHVTTPVLLHEQILDNLVSIKRRQPDISRKTLIRQARAIYVDRGLSEPT